MACGRSLHRPPAGSTDRSAGGGKAGRGISPASRCVHSTPFRGVSPPRQGVWRASGRAIVSGWLWRRGYGRLRHSEGQGMRELVSRPLLVRNKLKLGHRSILRERFGVVILTFLRGRVIGEEGADHRHKNLLTQRTKRTKTRRKVRSDMAPSRLIGNQSSVNGSGSGSSSSTSRPSQETRARTASQQTAAPERTERTVPRWIMAWDMAPLSRGGEC